MYVTYHRLAVSKLRICGGEEGGEEKGKRGQGEGRMGVRGRGKRREKRIKNCGQRKEKGARGNGKKGRRIGMGRVQMILVRIGEEEKKEREDRGRGGG